jgi:tRNA pseudouridine55 synthase
MKPDSFARGFLILIDKPGGMTSHDVVERVRRSTGIPRIGHSGTLDPMATGLLLLCAGGAARLQGFFTLMDKSYEGTIRLGRATTTYDREGEPLWEDRDPSGIGVDELEAAAAGFRGDFQQAPPPYSAKKVKGRKLYEMARKGEEIPVVPKRVRVTELRLAPPAGGRVEFWISCSSGTYIRSIAHAIGQAVGCGAHLESLRRTRIGAFRAEEAVALELFESLPLEERLGGSHAVPLARVPFPFERFKLASLEVWKVRKGQSIPARGLRSRDGDWVTLLGPADEMVALAQMAPIGQGGVSILKPRIVLAEDPVGRRW